MVKEAGCTEIADLGRMITPCAPPFVISEPANVDFLPLSRQASSRRGLDWSGQTASDLLLDGSLALQFFSKICCRLASADLLNAAKKDRSFYHTIWQVRAAKDVALIEPDFNSLARVFNVTTNPFPGCGGYRYLQRRWCANVLEGRLVETRIWNASECESAAC